MNWNAILPEAILAIGILTVFILELFLERKHYKFLSVLAFIFVVLSGYSIFFVNYPAKLFFDGFSVDALNLIGKLFILAVTGFVLLSSYDYFSKKNSQYGELPYLYLIATLGLMVMISSDNLAIIFTGLELASITMYILVGLFRREYLSKEGAFKYLVIGTTGTSMYALGSALVYASSGSMVLSPVKEENTLFALGVILIISALALKVSAVPFHFWTPDAYEGAPTPTTAYLSTVPKIGMYFLFVKLTMYLFSAFPDWKYVVMLLAVLSMFYGNIVAYAQKSVKRLLAYSSIAHAGYFLTALTAVDKHLFSALLFYVFVYALATVGAFTVLAILEKKEGWTHHFLDFKGLKEENPVLASMLALFLFALIGIPPAAVFLGKLGIFFGLVKTDMFALGILFAIASLISAGYYLKVIVYMFLYSGEVRHGQTTVSAGEAFTVLGTAFLVIFFGLFPHVVLDFILRALS
ncbi:NADH-quinone oxidoreductase subunit N [Aquifex aeolicus]|uniref:NADH-quinone oxidoreductase subunit N 1 n=1 Tax=Aquifex aeolicus (strain VF5) TaxID=224324 RepID=NUON1_AQUAE|nr:NADH-quinone oxidoreductase subunit N [Aquifex aeolicus]O67342.1 RecName: Full=NADH-quinone oxidoreductase subunit N 1; AltName: Full=NADH dehydrogenase I subunit N 1; AltName: Full=NDH-1 subunit N 1 [Aquifex aeolicus VF5]AAC07305.1 NADH dehydrogenase I chain N [Aquifex aeolicus VF5]